MDVLEQVLNEQENSGIRPEMGQHVYVLWDDGELHSSKYRNAPDGGVMIMPATPYQVDAVQMPRRHRGNGYAIIYDKDDAFNVREAFIWAGMDQLPQKDKTLMQTIKNLGTNPQDPNFDPLPAPRFRVPNAPEMWKYPYAVTDSGIVYHTVDTRTRPVPGYNVGSERAVPSWFFPENGEPPFVGADTENKAVTIRNAILAYLN